MPLRVPAQRRRSQETGAERPGAAGALPAAAFNRRVHLLVEAVDQPDELALAQGLMEARGWTVRRAGREDAPATAGRDRVALIVEVRLNGSRRRAEKAACGAVERLARTHQLGLWVRDAALLARPDDDPRTEYRVIRRPGGGSSWRDRLARWSAACGGRGTHRLLRLPNGLTREAIERELTERPLGGGGFTPEAYELRPAPPETEQEAAVRARRTASWVRALPGAVGLVAVAASGFLLPGLSGASAAVAVLVVVLAWPAVARAPWQPSPEPAVRTAAGAALVAGALLLGRTASPWHSSGGAGALGALGALGASGAELLWWLPALSAFCAPGVYFALRDSWFSRNAVWLVPLALPVGWSLVTWLGRLMQSSYLDRFGIPSGSVRSAEGLGQYAAAAEPLGLALAFVLFFTAVTGWLRHLHVAKGDNRLALLAVAVLLSGAFAVTSLVAGARTADSAARDAASDARRGRAPHTYFGLRGALMCVAPVGQGPVPVENGPVPEDRAVLSFGASGDWIWLWDPRRSQALSVRREDVRLLPAPEVSGGSPRTGCGR